MANNLFLLLFIIFGTSFYIGKLLQKIRIPWIFTGLLLGTVFSIQGSWFSGTLTSEPFTSIAELGVLLLLFIIGFSIDTKSIKEQGSFILRSTAAVILGEAFIGTLLLHTIFDISWGVSVLVATSFATVGEAVLLPILDEFNLTKKKLGQTILGIGVLDDIVEVVIILILSIVISYKVDTNIFVIVKHLMLAVFLVLSPLLIRFTGFLKHSWRYAKTAHLFVGTMMFFSLFIWIGSIIDAPELAAIVAGIIVRGYLPDGQIKMFESEINTMAYGFFAPLFFVSVGYKTDFTGIGSILPLILLIALTTSLAKIIITYYSTRKKLGSHESIIAGIALTVRLSTSIIVIKILYDNQVIPSDVFSALIGTTIVFKFLNPPLIAYLIRRWKIASPGTSAGVSGKASNSIVK